MKNSVGLGVFGTFGNPFGFQTLFFSDAHFTQTLDLNPNAIELTPETNLFAVRKELINGVYTICYCIYTYAREPQSSRKGSFIGSCIVFTNCQANDSSYIYDCLREFHNDTIEHPKNIINDTLQVQEPRALVIREPDTFSNLLENLISISINFSSVSNKESYLINASGIPENFADEDVSLFFSKAVNEFPNIGTMYFTTSGDVVKYVETKNLIKVIPLEDFKDYESPQKSPPQKSSEKKKLNEDSQPKPKSVSSESAETKATETGRMWGVPRNNWNKNEIKERVKEHNDLVTGYNRLASEYNTLLHNYNSGKRVRVDISNSGNQNIISQSSIYEVLDFIKHNALIIGLVLAFLLTWIVVIYLYLSLPSYGNTNSNNSNTNSKKSTNTAKATPKEESSPNEEQESKEESTPPTGSIPESDSAQLTPEPNGKLGSKGLSKLNQLIPYKMKASNIVDKAIEFNPNSIGAQYTSQKNQYKVKLITLNPNSFEKNNDDPLFISNLKEVPIYNQKE